jgi:hypothetical protein
MILVFIVHLISIPFFIFLEFIFKKLSVDYIKIIPLVSTKNYKNKNFFAFKKTSHTIEPLPINIDILNIKENNNSNIKNFDENIDNNNNVLLLKFNNYIEQYKKKIKKNGNDIQIFEHILNKHFTIKNGFKDSALIEIESFFDFKKNSKIFKNEYRFKIIDNEHNFKINNKNKNFYLIKLIK